MIKALVASPHPSQTTHPARPAASQNPKQTDTTPPSRYRSTSLKELGREKATSQVTLSTSLLKDASSDFSQDDLVKYWIEYADSLTAGKIHLKNTLNSCKPVLKEDFLFEVAVYNPSQKDEVAESSAFILSYLCNKLNNNRIKMDIRIVEKDEVEMIYTTAEKFEYLSKKNPNIENLMAKFDLTMG